MRHAGAGLRQDADLIIVDMDEMGEPNIAAEVIVIGHPLHGTLAVGGKTELDVGHGFREVAVDAQTHAPGALRDDVEFVGFE